MLYIKADVVSMAGAWTMVQLHTVGSAWFIRTGLTLQLRLHLICPVADQGGFIGFRGIITPVHLSPLYETANYNAMLINKL